MATREQTAPAQLASYYWAGDYTLALTFQNRSDARRLQAAIEDAYGSIEEDTPAGDDNGDAAAPAADDEDDDRAAADDPDDSTHVTPPPLADEALEPPQAIAWATACDVQQAQIGPASKRYPYLLAAPCAGPGDDVERCIVDGFKVHKHWGLENVHLVNVSTQPDRVLRVRYPKGTSSPSDNGKGGAGFYAAIDRLKGAEAAVLQYDVRFPSGFDFVKGGKMPGLYGGNAPSGGMKPGKGFTTRMMWRTNGDGELYLYCVNQGGHYGLSVGRGLFKWPTGRWATLEQEIVLNDPGCANGIARIWINGNPIFEIIDVVYRHDRSLTIDGLMFSTFFGGSSSSWRTPRDQDVDFTAFRIYGPA